MTDGYLSKDRDHLNRMQRERRARLVRIDYHPGADVLALIEAKRPRYGPEATNSATLNAIVREWAEATGIKCREVDRPKTSERDAGASSRITRARETSGPALSTPSLPSADSIKSGGAKGLSSQQRVPCGAKRRRDGKPCQAFSVPGKHRCKWHGGASTGPKSVEGKLRSLANLRRGNCQANLQDSQPKDSTQS